MVVTQAATQARPLLLVLSGADADGDGEEDEGCANPLAGVTINFGGKAACKLAVGLDKFAARARAAVPQLRYVAEPVGKLLAAL